MYAKMWKVLIVFAIIGIDIVLPELLPGYPLVVRVIVLIAASSYGVSLVFKADLSATRRLATAYLAVTAIVYLSAGLLGLIPNLDLVEGWVWSKLVSPYVWINYSVLRRPPMFSTSPYGPHLEFSTVIVIVSICAIIIAVAMAWSSRIAYAAGLALLLMSVVSLSAYVVVGLRGWPFPPILTPSCWEITYVVAFLLARQGYTSRVRVWMCGLVEQV